MLNVNYVKLLEQSGIFRYITPDNYEKAADELEITSMKYVNNQVIFRQNDKASQLALVVSGEVKAEKYMAAVATTWYTAICSVICLHMKEQYPTEECIPWIIFQMAIRRLHSLT